MGKVRRLLIGDLDKSGSCDGEKTGRLERDLGSKNGQDLESPWVYIGRREGGQVSSGSSVMYPSLLYSA